VDVDLGAGDEFGGGNRFQLPGNTGRVVLAWTGNDDMGSRSGGLESGGGGAGFGFSGNHDNTAAELLLWRLAAKFGLFHGPIFDAEGFAGRQGNVVGEDLEAGWVEAFAALGQRASDLPFSQEGSALNDVDGIGVKTRRRCELRSCSCQS